MLKVPNNSFTRGAIVRMNDMGGPALTSAQITCIASAMRAALTALDGWERWMSKLKAAALDYGYMGRWLRGEWWPTCWSSAPIAKHLQNVLDPDYWARTRLPAIAHAVRAVFARLGLGGADRSTKAQAQPRLQAQIYKVLLQVAFPDDACRLYRRRLRALQLEDPGEQALHHWIDDVRKLPQQTAWLCHCSLAGAWPTSRRLHDPETSVCLFGCPAADELSHYVRCRRLWMVASLEGPPVQASPLARLGFVDDIQRTGALRRLAAALHVYRCVRLTPAHRESAKTARNSSADMERHFLILRRVWRAAAHAFSLRPGERYGKALPPRARSHSHRAPHLNAGVGGADALASGVSSEMQR